LKRLLGTWDRNGSTSGPTSWQTYDDDDDDWMYWFYLYFLWVIDPAWPNSLVSTNIYVLTDGSIQHVLLMWTLWDPILCAQLGTCFINSWPEDGCMSSRNM
jgi:hypothetical protein